MLTQCHEDYVDKFIIQNCTPKVYIIIELLPQTQRYPSLNADIDNLRL